MSHNILVAGIGNIFLGDDGFGVEVVRRLASCELPPSVTVADFGIRGLHLAFELLEHEYETVVLVDATARGGSPGTLYLIDVPSAPGDTLPGSGARGADADAVDHDVADDAAPVDAHGMTPENVLALLASLGGTPGRVFVVGCEPARIDEGMELSPVVAASIDDAVALVLKTIGAEISGTESAHVSRHTGADCSVQ